MTDDEIAYAVVGTKPNNPLGTCILDCYVDGIEAYFAFRNSEGGIYGRELVARRGARRRAGQEPGARRSRSISGDDAFGDFQATLLASGWGDLDEAGVPTYAWGIHAAEAANRPHIFPSIADPLRRLHRPVVPYAAKQAGATKVASLGYGITENSKDCTDTASPTSIEQLRGRHRRRGRLHRTTTSPSACPTASAPRSRP